MKSIATALAAICVFLNGCPTQQASRERAYIHYSNAKSERREKGIETNVVGVGKEMNDRAMALFPEVAASIKSADESGKKIVLPKLIKATPPSYPYIATLTPTQGEIWVGFLVEPDGNVGRVESLVDADNSFAQAAVTAVKKWKFIPGTIEGAPTQFMFTVPIHFVLE
jgi:TonB family protein